MLLVGASVTYKPLIGISKGISDFNKDSTVDIIMDTADTNEVMPFGAVIISILALILL